MSSPDLESIKKKHPSLSASIDALAGYVQIQLERSGEVVPELAAQYLKLSEAATLGLLLLFEKAGLVTPVYNIYCHRKGTLLKTVSSKGEIPSAIYCKFCDEDHQCDAEDVDVELAFRARTGAWKVPYVAV